MRHLFKKGNIPWNKGLKLGKNPEHSRIMTGKKFNLTEEQIKQRSERVREEWKNGKRKLHKNFLKNTFKKGHKTSEKIKDKIGESNIGKHSGKDNGMWKEDAGYTALHLWVVKMKGHPSHCEVCGKTGSKNKNGRWNIHYANIDHTYQRVLDDYIGMCPRCHKEYDCSFNN